MDFETYIPRQRGRNWHPKCHTHLDSGHTSSERELGASSCAEVPTPRGNYQTPDRDSNYGRTKEEGKVLEPSGMFIAKKTIKKNWKREMQYLERQGIWAHPGVKREGRAGRSRNHVIASKKKKKKRSQLTDNRDDRSHLSFFREEGQLQGGSRH